MPAPPPKRTKNTPPLVRQMAVKPTTATSPLRLVIESSDDEELVEIERFRINCNKVALTYSCPQAADDNPIVSKEMLLDRLLAIIEDRELELDGYIVAEEKHDNEKKHYHVQLNFSKKIDIKNSRFFDVMGVHPKVEKAGNGWVSYCAKMNNYLINNITIPVAKDAAKQAAKLAWETALGLAEDQKVNDAMAHLRKWQPREYLAKSEVYRKSLTAVAASARIFKRPAKVYTTRWTEEIENINPLAVDEGEEFPRTLIFAGPQGIGKTEAAKYVLQKAGFPKVLIVNQPEDLKRLYDYDAFVYDECNINAPDNKRGAWEREEQIMLLDYAEDRTIPARYTNIEIPRMTPRILTTNNVARCVNFTAEGINRRVKIFNFTDKLYN